MTDLELVQKRLALVETCVMELRTLSQPDKIPSDIREERFAEHTLQIAIQAALDSASHIVSSERLGEPQTNRALFEILGKRGWLSADLASELEKMAGFRNLLVHGYTQVDPSIVADVVVNHLETLTAFAKAIRSRLSASP